MYRYVVTEITDSRLTHLPTCLEKYVYSRCVFHLGQTLGYELDGFTSLDPARDTTTRPLFPPPFPREGNFVLKGEVTCRNHPPRQGQGRKLISPTPLHTATGRDFDGDAPRGEWREYPGAFLVLTLFMQDPLQTSPRVWS